MAGVKPTSSVVRFPDAIKVVWKISTRVEFVSFLETNVGGLQMPGNVIWSALHVVERKHILTFYHPEIALVACVGSSLARLQELNLCMV